ncbi:MAG: glycosyltransferase family 4 protein, partial [Candidatus Omnitrophica bacterium]|nr:glycosyltransferase family 4 protein [Candidatus Omnitrophota bacterium]
MWVAFRFNIPLVISVRDLFPEAARGLEGSQNKILNLFLDIVTRVSLRRADHVVALGSLMQKRLIESKGVRKERVSIITDWADSKKIAPVPKHNTFSFVYHISTFFVVMYSGNLGASSGVEIMLESARILKDYRDIVFVLIGEGVMKEKLITLAQKYRLENIKFLPYQPQEILPYSFSSADIFVIPLKKGLAGYSLPSKVYPILASGHPYIACVEEESEIFRMAEEFKCGLCAKPQDAADLTKKILIFYKDKDLKLSMGHNARKAALSFDRPQGVRIYYELFKSLLKPKENV